MLFIRRYPLAHLAIGLLGNLLFLTGSTLFVLGLSHPAGYLFLAGSFAMLLGALGEVVKAIGRRAIRRHDAALPNSERTGPRARNHELTPP
ncbi:YrhK-like protein [Micromonospora siamensis]|uniref:YrhK-like protein n=2 Tax=Micromonospora siamensis TaxID=299152 RepID=A0A1C5K458_9ACTN|nr:YrhK-like protein [Micromonospora siamensis]